jgi:hypothetical protein
VTEQRRFPRHAIALPLYISVDGGVLRKTVPLESRDVSAGGVAFETSRKVPLAADARLVLSRFGDLPENAYIRGRVARVAPEDEHGRRVVGVEFCEFVGVTREGLIERIARWTEDATPTPPPAS